MNTVHVVKIHPAPQNSELTNVLRSWCQSRHLENFLKQTVLRELDKILNIKFFAEVTKRNGDTTEQQLESLKIMQSAIGRYFKEENYPRGIVHNSKRIHRRIPPAAPSNSFSKDNEKSQPQPQK